MVFFSSCDCLYFMHWITFYVWVIVIATYLPLFLHDSSNEETLLENLYVFVSCKRRHVTSILHILCNFLLSKFYNHSQIWNHHCQCFVISCDLNSNSGRPFFISNKVKIFINTTTRSIHQINCFACFNLF